MIEILNPFFQALTHPFAYAESLRVKRISSSQNSGVFSLVKEEDGEKLSFYEWMSVSWIFQIVKAIYAVLALSLSALTISLIPDNAETPLQFLLTWTNAGQKVALFGTLFQVILFPLGAFVYLKFWSLLIGFFADLFDFRGDKKEVGQEIVLQSFSANAFLVIPVFGELAKMIASLLSLYAGLRMNMGLNKYQSFIVILSPLILFALFGVLMLLYLFLIFSALFS